jgi:ribose 5-phosphate isomerase A
MRRRNVPGSIDAPSVRAVVAHALTLIEDGFRVGLGSGRAATALVMALGAEVRHGLRVEAVPTSPASARAAHDAGIR